MNIFEFKAAGPGNHFFIDLEAIQVITALAYVEEPYFMDGEFGPGGGGVAGGTSKASFQITLALRTDFMTVAHQSGCQAEGRTFEGQTAYAKAAGLKELERRSPEMKRYVGHLNKVPNPYPDGRAFKAEYERLVAAWTTCPSRNK